MTHLNHSMKLCDGLLQQEVEHAILVYTEIPQLADHLGRAGDRVECVDGVGGDGKRDLNLGAEHCVWKRMRMR